MHQAFDNLRTAVALVVLWAWLLILGVLLVSYELATKISSVIK